MSNLPGLIDAHVVNFQAFTCALLSPPKVVLRRRKIHLHARSREGPDDCRWQQVNCARFLPASKAFVSPLISWEPYSTIFLQACWFRYSNGFKKGPQSCMDTSSQILPSIGIFLVWRKLRSIRKRTKQLCLVGGHFFSALQGARAIQNFNLKELIKYYSEVLHNAPVKIHESMQIEDRYKHFRDDCRSRNYPLDTCGTNLVLCMCPLWRAISQLGARSISTTRAGSS